MYARQPPPSSKFGIWDALCWSFNSRRSNSSAKNGVRNRPSDEGREKVSAQILTCRRKEAELVWRQRSGRIWLRNFECSRGRKEVSEGEEEGGANARVAMRIASPFSAHRRQSPYSSAKLQGEGLQVQRSEGVEVRARERTVTPGRNGTTVVGACE